MTAIGVTDLPAPRPHSGRVRWTPMTAFMDVGGDALPFIARHNAACIDRLNVLLGPRGTRHAAPQAQAQAQARRAPERRCPRHGR